MLEDEFLRDTSSRRGLIATCVTKRALPVHQCRHRCDLSVYTQLRLYKVPAYPEGLQTESEPNQL